jgi:Lanthionine synthetase C-like protein
MGQMHSLCHRLSPRNRSAHNRRLPGLLLGAPALGLAILIGGLGSQGAARASKSASPASSVALGQVGQQLLAQHVTVPGAGWAWRSVIQAPHLQTDRDVGTAGVLIGLLALYSATKDSSYLDAGRQAGNWLVSVAEPSEGGLRWPDWVDGPNSRSNKHFTSFDDGTPGIADALWRLGSVTGDQRYTQAALAGMRWEEAQAQSLGRGIYRWAWYDSGGVKASDHETGIGEGQAGIVYAFATFARRTGDPRYLRYSEGGAAYLESLITPAGAIPEQPGSTSYDTGYLSGAAGDAFAFLTLYQDTGQRRWLNDASRLLSWLSANGKAQAAGAAWAIEVDPKGHSQNDQLATGIEEGAAGIGWVELQAYKITGSSTYLRTAESAGQWLRSVAKAEPSGLAWPENSGTSQGSPSLDNGAAGIGWFLDDLWLATNETSFERSAQGARDWLTSLAEQSAAGVPLTGKDGTTKLPNEPSWHWGDAGIAAFLVRAAGWQLDMPGEEPATWPSVGSARSVSVTRGVRHLVRTPATFHDAQGRRGLLAGNTRALLFGQLVRPTLLRGSVFTSARGQDLLPRSTATVDGSPISAAAQRLAGGGPTLRSLTMNTAIALPPSA